MGNTLNASLCAYITHPGKLLMFGAGDEGQLGRALTSDIQYSHIPTVVDLETNVLSVACGAKHTMALTTEGAVYAFGANNMGQLGLAESPPMNIVHTPSQVDIPVDLSRRQAHTQGIATPERCGGCPSLPTKTANPQTKCGGGGHALVQEKGNVHTDERTLSPGETHSEVVMRLSQLSPSMARRGKQPPPIITTAPTPPPPVAHATSISCGLHHSVVVTRHGGVYACGNRQALAVHADTAIIDAKKRAGACTRARAHAQACAQGADTCCGDWKAYENELKTCCDTPVASHTTGNKGDVASSECGNARKTCGDARDVRGDAEKSSTRQCSNQPAHFTASCNETALTLLCSLGNLSKRSGKDGPEGAVRVAAGGNHVCVYLVA
ncbi:hypothetical protein SARC_10625 [Sphaeroforma arctica JP610]|uniref:Uncharacterized protein n=1 Tax=Sphaeroforma arctica JP610 TaxID=667725 RepID=A0A0L0FJC7_9EUKA|nr:hypothetical protein SARC_10625 [Sphaeroforma arctica JP610]KNC76899.1 hypothetical protein SARC_10625 [Sphaeroforma arctica JP610]|eukprot:XP_014150801.1 hypothetical protein SARC_10625 [Sphaeroforma arctica JP610]